MAKCRPTSFFFRAQVSNHPAPGYMKLHLLHSQMFKGRTTKPCPTHVLNAYDAHDFITPIKSNLMYFIFCSFTPRETFLWTSAVMEQTLAPCPYFTWQFSGNGSDNHHVMNAAVWCHACLCMRLSNETRRGMERETSAQPCPLIRTTSTMSPRESRCLLWDIPE